MMALTSSTKGADFSSLFAFAFPTVCVFIATLDVVAIPVPLAGEEEVVRSARLSARVRRYCSIESKLLFLGRLGGADG